MASRANWVLQVFPVFKGSEKAFLHGVFGVMMVPQDGVRDPEDHGAVLSHQIFHRRTCGLKVFQNHLSNNRVSCHFAFLIVMTFKERKVF